MKKLSIVLAALATIAIAAPAVAQDKPMMKRGMHEGMGMHKGGMHRKMMMRHKMRHMRHRMMKRDGM